MHSGTNGLIYLRLLEITKTINTTKMKETFYSKAKP